MPSREEEIEERLEWEERKDDTPVFYHMIAGSCAGVSEHLCMFPVDTYKVCVCGLIPPQPSPQGLYPRDVFQPLSFPLALTLPPPTLSPFSFLLLY